MSKKTSILMFAIGAAAGWTAAQKFSEQREPWSSSAETVPTMPSWEPVAEQPSTTQQPATGGDPFRGAFQGAMQELELRSKLDEEDEPDSQVA